MFICERLGSLNLKIVELSYKRRNKRAHFTEWDIFIFCPTKCFATPNALSFAQLHPAVENDC